MSLLDLKSDLSKYRWKGPSAPIDPNSKTPRATSYGDNFGSFQPISNNLLKSGTLPKITEPKEIDLVSKLDNTRLDNIITDMRESSLVQRLENTRLDDIQKPENKSVLINSVSEFSPKAKDNQLNPLSRIATEDVTSELARINQDVQQTNITKSDVVVLKQTSPGENNNNSKTDIIKRDNQTGNVKDPNVIINRKPLSIGRESQSAVIIKDLRTAINNITDPGTPITPVIQTKDRQNESPSVDNNINVTDIIVNTQTNSLLKDTIFDVTGNPIKYSKDSKIVLKQKVIVDTTKYNTESELDTAYSNLNLDDTKKTIPDGRHNTDNKTELSNKNEQEINFFPNTNADGFTNKVQHGVSEYKNGSSVLGYDIIAESNYFDISNKYTTDGFHAFAKTGEPTKYKEGASSFDWDGDINKTPLADYLDINRSYTTSGFHAFAKTGEPTKYKIDSSIFDWDGLSVKAPTVNYFDLSNRYTTAGFHKFAIEYDTKYINDASRFDWNGVRGNAPSVNYFDLFNQRTWRGFHTFAFTQEPTSYITTAIGQPVIFGNTVSLLSGVSAFDWDGFRGNAPSVNYFDRNNQRTWRGFHGFAFTQEPTSYQTSANGQLVTAATAVILAPTATIFDWDGIRNNAPSVNYFDLFNQRSWRGFHTFAFTQEPTSYQTTANGQPIIFGNRVSLLPGTTAFDWFGFRPNAPSVNYFDLFNQRTWRGFHTFAFPQEPTSYQTSANGQLVTAATAVILAPTATVFDWNGFRGNAVAVNYFDLNNQRTWRGFHTFSFTREPTSYQTTANGQLVSQFGNPVTLTTGPFGATQFDWDGTLLNAPAVNYMDFGNQWTFQGFHTFATEREPTSYQTQLIGNVLTLNTRTTSFTSGAWTGPRANAAFQVVNFFDLSGPFRTRNNGTQGFHAFAQPLEQTAFRTVAATPSSRTLPVFFGSPIDLHWSGARTAAPTVNYFDPNNIRTTRGFHTFAFTKEPTSYQTRLAGNSLILHPVATQFDWNGNNSPLFIPAVNYFDQIGRSTRRGFHTFAFTKEPTSYRTIQAGITTVLDPIASFLDWNSPFLVNTPLQPGAPAVNYFDLNNQRTSRGFHTFASTQEPTSYRTVRVSGSAFGLHPNASALDWDGSRLNVNVVNYFDLSRPFRTTRGFHAFAQTLEPTSYVTIQSGNISTLRANTTAFDWNGSRQFAPAVNFFDPTNQRTVRGFHILATQLEPTSYQTNQVGLVSNLTAGATQFDWNGIDPYSIQTTRFFGFNQTTRFGFMVNMSQFDGTAYPIINPTFNANILRIPGFPQRLQRFALSTIRQVAQPLQTSNLEQFAPLTFGGKTISGFRSTLDVQTPAVIVSKLNLNVATNRVRINPTAVGFTKRYTTGGGVDVRPSVVDGNMVSWANSKLIDDQHKKYSLRNEAYNDDLIGIREPYVDGSLYGNEFIKIPKFDDGIVRGGAIASTIRTGLDTIRIGKFLASGKGILWNIKQFGLQAMNPNVDDEPSSNFLQNLFSPKVATQIYNPLSVPANILGKSIIVGKKYTRHGILMDGSEGRYERATISRALRTDGYGYFDNFSSQSNNDYNRLIGLVKELLPNSYDTTSVKNTTQTNNSLEIKRISSSHGGPNSVLGLFGTYINRATHPFKIINSTEYLPDRNKINLGLDRDVFFSARFDSGNRQNDTYSAMLLREIEKYDGDMYGLILQAAKISTQTYTPVWDENNKNLFNSSDSKIQLMTKERIDGFKVFEFKQPTLNERLHALNSGYIPYREKNESIAGEVFFLGQSYEQTYYDRLFGQTKGEITQYGNIYGLILGSTVGIKTSGIVPKFDDGRQIIDKTEFKVPLNKYDVKRIEDLDIYGFKKIPINERAKRITSENISPRKDLENMASDIFYTSDLIKSSVNPISKTSYGDYLLAKTTSNSDSQQVQNLNDVREFSLGILGSIALNSTLNGIERKLEYEPSLQVDYNKIPINDKTKTLIEKLKPFEFIAPPIQSRYKAITSENAQIEGSNLYSEMYFGNAKTKYEVVEGTNVNKLSYGSKLANDWATKNTRVYGLILEAATINLKQIAMKDSNGSLVNVNDSGAPVWDIYSATGNYDGNATKEAYPKEDITINSKVIERLKALKTFDFKYPDPYERFSSMQVMSPNAREGNVSLSDGPNVDPLTRTANPIQKYKTLNYNDLGKNKPAYAWWNVSQPNDFRKQLTNNYDYFSTDPEVVNYKKYGVELTGDGTGFGDPGVPGYRKNRPFISNIHYTSGVNSKITNAYTGSQQALNLPSNRKYGAYPVIKDEIKKIQDAEQAVGNPVASFFRGDRINIIDWKRSEQNLNVNTVYEKLSPMQNQMNSSQDLIQFYFSGVDLIASENRPTEAIVFRAYLDTIVDNHKPTWTPIKYIGRADPVYSYDGYEREISFGFTVHTGTRDELKATWRKLNMLASWTTPDYIDPGFMKAPICRLNIGNLYRKFPGFISSLTYTFDNSLTTWETAKLAEDLNISDTINGPLSKPGALELPKTILVQCSFVTFNIYRPQWDCVFYSLFDDTTGGASVETGLVPMSDDRVNYFRTHDDLPVTHPMNALLCAVIPPPKEPVKKIKKTTTETVNQTTSPPPTTTPPPATTPPPSTTGAVLPEKICICKIDFCFDEDREVTPESRQAIVQVANWLNTCPNIKVKVKAYCSREADNFAYNKLLSMARAVTVCNMLIEECGVSSTRLVPVGMGFGDYKEAYKPESKKRWAKQQNRRVIFEVIEGAGTCNYTPSFDCNPEAKECDKSEYCYRKDGTKFWRVGPHYFTGTRFVEEGGKSVGETYTGWPRSTGPVRPPGLSLGAFNSKTKLQLPYATDLTKRIAWHTSYRIQNPDETQGVAQQTYDVWFDPLTNANQHFQLEGTAEKPVITISGGDTPIDIWVRRYTRDTTIKNSKGKYTHINTGFSGTNKGSDNLDNVTYIINPNE